VTQTRAFRCEPEAVAAARGFVRHVLRHQHQQTVDAAELMASEVVTNCVRHARTDFELTILSRGQIRIEVRDSGQGRPTPLSPSSRERSGRGLRIVEAMSDDWGVIPASSGKTVWFTVPQHVAASEASSSAGSGERGAATSGPKSSDVISESRVRNMFPHTCSASAWPLRPWLTRPHLLVSEILCGSQRHGIRSPEPRLVLREPERLAMDADSDYSKPTRGLEPRTPSLRASLEPCNGLRLVVKSPRSHVRNRVCSAERLVVA